MHGSHIREQIESAAPRRVPEEPAETGQAPEGLPDLHRFRTRLAGMLSILLVVLLLAFVPPLINVSRFQRRIASNLSASLGRPVHLDRVSLTLLPLPGFTLENFVVNEDPAFGYEPILRANQVRATVRISSLWSHHVEFSRISLTEPTSLNLVRLADGRWNFEPVLLQASRIEAAPTAQTYAGSAPRFPYIEASGARINLKLGQDKTPFALTESDFSLWLPGPRQWRFRLEAHPARTDVAPSDAGILRLEGALGGASAQAGTLGQLPLEIRALWDAAPLAGLSRIAFGRDIGLRGDLTADIRAVGTVESSRVSATLKLARGRRADFVPARLLGLNATCEALAGASFQSFTNIQCRWPETSIPGQAGLVASGTVPEVRRPESASASITATALPLPVLLDWVQAATPHAPTALTGPGLLSGSLAWTPGGHPAWSGALTLSDELLNLPGPAGPTLGKPVALGEITLRSAPPQSPADRTARRRSLSPVAVTLGHGSGRFDLGPFPLPLGGRQQATLEGHFDGSGYTLHLTGPAVLSRLLALGDAFPQFGEGLRQLLEPDNGDSPAADADTPIRVDLWASRKWGQAQSWTNNSASPANSAPARASGPQAPSPLTPPST